MPGDLQQPDHCRAVIAKAVAELGSVDILVNNAAHQATFKSIEDISDEEWELTFKVNIHAMFYLTKAAVPHMKPGSCIINTASINSDAPNPTLLAYATTKGAIHNFTAGLAQMLAEKGIRANAVAPGPIWTPLQVSGGADAPGANAGVRIFQQLPDELRIGPRTADAGPEGIHTERARKVSARRHPSELLVRLLSVALGE